MRAPDLPIYNYRSVILEELRECGVVVLSAPTGSGKSTQVPQFLLDSGTCPAEILVLQPRRIAAKMLAHRIVQERGGRVGDEIGFQTRFEKAVSSQTRVRFITEGILPRMLMGTPHLDSVSAVIFDEFHERSITNDIGLSLIRELRNRVRSDLKIIVMSATLESGPVASFLPGAAQIAAEGAMYPVDIRYRSPGDHSRPWEKAARAAADLIKETSDGDILVFMPGAYEIRRTVSALENIGFGEPVQIETLHGDHSPEAQQRVLTPGTRRKVIVATNIAETSLTIPGVRHVVDSGLARINRYDPARGFTTLYVEPISVASADQRAGRAGREAPGICIRMWTQGSHAGRADRTPPEILRVDLAETVLTLSRLGYTDPYSFDWFEPPPDKALHRAVDLLQDLHARNRSTGDLTPIGEDMSRLPMHPRLGRLVLEASRRGVFSLGVLSAAVLSERGALTSRPVVELPPDQPASDFVALAILLAKAREARFERNACAQLGINGSAARTIDRTAQYYADVCTRQNLDFLDAATDPGVELAKALLIAYPDHLARKINPAMLQCELRHGKKGELSKMSAVRKADLCIAADIRETRNVKKSMNVVLSLASEVRVEWLEELFPETEQVESKLVWNPSKKAVEQRETRSFLGVVIEENFGFPSNTQEASGVLADTIIASHLKLDSWDTKVDDLVERIRWVSEHYPDQKIPTLNEDECRLIVHELCEGEIRYDKVKGRPVDSIVRSFVTAPLMRFVDYVAPDTLLLPSGRKLRITYKAGHPPRGRARIQDLFGMNQSPRVAEGRVVVLLEVLAPNNRPVQITEDLGSFWQNAYPELKKSLSRRYPKHQWR